MSGKNSNNENLSNSQNEENALWSIVGYLLSGLLIWGGIGWGLDRWLGTTYLVLVGMLLGAGASIYFCLLYTSDAADE